MDDKQVTVTQAGAVADCSGRTIIRAIRDGDLGAQKRAGRILIDRSELDRWIRTRTDGWRRRALERQADAALQFLSRVVEQVMASDPDGRSRRRHQSRIPATDYCWTRNANVPK